MDIYALDKDLKLMSIAIPYDELTWTRRYYAPGEFMLTVPLELYDSNWAYIGTPDRKELAMVQKMVSTSQKSVTIQGFFLEKMLDEEVCYPRYIGDVSKTETAVRNIFTRYKGALPIVLGPANSPLLGDRTQSDFSDDELGDKLYRILESRELSLRVLYDFFTNEMALDVWQGLDRTGSQSANSTQTFSLEFGNVQGRTVDFDDSGWKNYAIIPVDGDDSNKERTTYYLDLSNGKRKRKIVFDMRSHKPEDGQTEADFKAAVLQEASEKMQSYQRIEDVDIEVVGAQGYMTDYDLGDKCDVILTDLDITMETRIAEVVETFKAGSGHAVTVGLGNKRISNLRRSIV